MKKINFVAQGIKKITGSLVILSALLITSCDNTDSTENAINADQNTETVESSTSLTGKPFTGYNSIGNGVNLQPSYSHGGNCDLGWNLMKQNSKIKTVRIEVEPNQVNNAKRWIAEAKANGYKVIVTYHKADILGSDNASQLLAAGVWWRDNYKRLGGGFIVNLINEWGSHNISASAFASAYNAAIKEVRKVYSGSIIIDIPGWGQETATAACAVKGCSPGQTKINDPKILLSAHIYPSSYNQGKGRFMNKSDLDDLASTGKQCIIGEFGDKADGSGADWSGIVAYAKQKNWTIIGWAWNGDGRSMNLATPSLQPFVNGKPKTYQKSSYFNVVYNRL